MATGGQARRGRRQHGRNGRDGHGGQAGRDGSLPLIDHDHLDRLSHHIGGPAVRALVAEGRAELADRLARLARPPDGEDIGTLAHQVAGLAGNLGLPLVARRAASAAEAARAGRDAGGALAALLEIGWPSLDALDGWRKAGREDGAA